ncbi:MAG: epoxyqueuosine reductase QueH [Lachnospiraceae bacterium]|nr:epoxyqueuosine reductase QueH [Lachnospiraceae bacterium]
MKRNYQKELEKIIEKQQRQREGQGGEEEAKGQQAPKLLLHSCCAPCSSYVLEYLSCYFQITVFYYNPNIYPEEEYEKRVEEQRQFIRQFQQDRQTFFYEIAFQEGVYEKERFYQMAQGLETVPEGGERCFRCYRLRLEEAARQAKGQKMDYFTTTLSISPLKNAEKLNQIGEELAQEYGVPYLVSDFKKKNGYKRSVELSEEYGMYRQDYCGCIFSMEERERQKKQRAQQIQE